MCTSRIGSSENPVTISPFCQQPRVLYNLKSRRIGCGGHRVVECMLSKNHGRSGLSKGRSILEAEPARVVARVVPAEAEAVGSFMPNTRRRARVSEAPPHVPLGPLGDSPGQV